MRRYKKFHVRNILFLVISFALLSSSMGLLSWYIPILLTHKLGTLSAIIFSFLFVDDMVFALVSGTLADVYGRKPLVVIGTLFLVIGFALIDFSLRIDNNILLSLGLVLGVGVASVTRPAATSLLMESCSPEFRGRVLSIFSVIENLALAVGSGVYGFLLTYLGNIGVFDLMLLLGLVALSARLFLVETLKTKSSTGRIISYVMSKYVDALKNYSYILSFDLLVGLAQGAVFYAFPLYLSDVLKLNSMMIGSLYAIIPIARLVLSPVAGWITDVNVLQAIYVGTVVTGLFYIPLIIVPYLKGFEILLAVLALIGSALTLFEGIAFNKLISIYVPENVLATVYGLSLAVFDFGMTIGSSIIGSTYFMYSSIPILIASILSIISYSTLKYTVKMLKNKRKQ